jgi:hypothetical protein
MNAVILFLAANDTGAARPTAKERTMTGKQIQKRLAKVGIKAEVCGRHEIEMSKTAFGKAGKHLEGCDWRAFRTGYGAWIVDVSGDHSGDALRALVAANID